MHIPKHLILKLALLLALLFLVNTLAAKPSNKWRLEFSGSARSDGVIVLVISPLGADPMRASIEIMNNTRENMVAEAVVQYLKKRLPREGYHIERDDGEDVLIKKRRGAANFNVEIISNTVRNVRINLDRE